MRNEFEELNKIKERFERNHKERMNQLNEAISSLNNTMDQLEHITVPTETKFQDLNSEIDAISDELDLLLSSL